MRFHHRRSEANVGLIVGFVIGGISFVIGMICVIWAIVGTCRSVVWARSLARQRQRAQALNSNSRLSGAASRPSPTGAVPLPSKAEETTKPLLATPISNIASSSSNRALDVDDVELRLMTLRDEADRGLAEIRAKRAAGEIKSSYDVPPAYDAA